MQILLSSFARFSSVRHRRLPTVEKVTVRIDRVVAVSDRDFAVGVTGRSTCQVTGAKTSMEVQPDIFKVAQ